MAEKMRFEFDGPRSWTWSYEDPERKRDEDYSFRRSYTLSITHAGKERWLWSVVGLFGEEIEFDDMNGKANSMQACVDAASELFKRVDIEISVPLPVSN